MTGLLPLPPPPAADVAAGLARREGGAGPGLVLAGLVGAAAVAVHATVPALSPTLVAVAVGMAAAVTGRVPAATRPGLAVAARRVLRVGVALLGLQLVMGDVLSLGWAPLVGVVAVVGGGIAGTLLLARRLGVGPDTGLLVACGFSICGAAAVAAVHGVRRSSADAVATALALVVIAGSVAMLAVPLLGRLLGLGAASSGAWAGASVHEVGQVVVAGGLLGGVALKLAVVVKLARVLMLAPVLAVVSWHERRAARGPAAPGGDVPAVRPPLVPGFVLAFLGCVALRSTGVVPEAALGAAEVVQSLTLAAAMFALGTGLRPELLRTLGRPVLLLAVGSSVLVAALGLPVGLLAR